MSFWRRKIHTCKYFRKDGVMCPLGPAGWWRQTAWLSSRLCHFLAWPKLGMTTIAPSLLVYYEDRMWTVETNVLAQSLAHISGHLINISPDYYDCFPFWWEDLAQPSFRRSTWQSVSGWPFHTGERKLKQWPLCHAAILWKWLSAQNASKEWKHGLWGNIT